MDSDCCDTPNDPSGRRPTAPKLRYDEPHPQPPAPMFVRLDFDPPPEAEER